MANAYPSVTCVRLGMTRLDAVLVVLMDMRGRLMVSVNLVGRLKRIRVVKYNPKIMMITNVKTVLNMDMWMPKIRSISSTLMAVRRYA